MVISCVIYVTTKCMVQLFRTMLAHDECVYVLLHSECFLCYMWAIILRASSVIFGTTYCVFLEYMCCCKLLFVVLYVHIKVASI